MLKGYVMRKLLLVLCLAFIGCSDKNCECTKGHNEFRYQPWFKNTSLRYQSVFICDEWECDTLNKDQ